MGSSPDNTPSKQSTMKKQSDSLDRKVKLILSKDLGDPDELRQDEKSSDDENGLNTVKEEDLSSAEDGTLLKVNPLAILFLPLTLSLFSNKDIVPRNALSQILLQLFIEEISYDPIKAIPSSTNLYSNRS